MPTQQDTPLVLVVDDDPSIIETVTELLVRAGLRTRHACDLSAALQEIKKQNPDLILLDVHLPDGTGLELCRRLQSDVVPAAPILFISGNSDTSMKLQGFEAGGLDFITKPIVGAEVIARVRTHLRLRQAYDQLSEVHADQLEGLASAQQQLMPQPRNGSSVRFYASVRQVLPAGGDFYDVIPLGEGLVDYIVADASGHDLAASLWTASLKTLAAEHANPLTSPVEIVLAINSSLCRFMPKGAFFTLIYARLNHGTGNLSVVSAGHPAAIITHSEEGAPRLLLQEGDVLGAFADAVFSDVEASLHTGDRLWLYTDGLIANGMPQEKALQRIADACVVRRKLPLPAAVPSVIGDMIGDSSPMDDLLLLGVDV